jgi:hypothetical protein
MKFNLSFIRHNIFYIGFILLLLVAFFVRVYQLDYPLNVMGGESMRDYMFAHHIILYHEYPLVGPFHSASSGFLKNSPLYYYFLASFLLFFDSIVTLQFANVFLQLASIIFIVLIANTLFGEKIALITGLIYSFLPVVLSHAYSVWQPYISEPFIYGSLFLLILSHKKKKEIFLLLSNILISVGFVLHNAVFGIFPLFILCCFILIKHDKFLKSLYIILPLTSASIFFVCYIPTFFSVNNSNITISGLSNQLFIHSFSMFLQHMSLNTRALLNFYSLSNYGRGLISINSFLLFILICFSFAYFFIGKREGRKCAGILLLFVFQQVLFSSISNNQQLYYITPILGLFTIYIAAVIGSFLSGNLLSNMLIVTYLSLLLFFPTNKFLSLRLSSYNETNWKVINQASILMFKKLDSLQNQSQSNILKSFSVVSYRRGSLYEDPAILLVPLEAHYGMEFSDELKHQNSDYLFLACVDNNDQKRINAECIRDFINNYKSFSYPYQLYSAGTMSLYFSRKIKI